MIYKKPPLFNTWIDKILYALWRFRFLSRKQLSILFDSKSINLSDLLKNMMKMKYIKLQVIDDRNYYLITKFGSEKIGVKHITSKVSFALSIHNTQLYQLIKSLNWANYLSEREFMMQVIENSKKENFLNNKFKNPLVWLRKNGTIPDLILLEKNKRIAIEYERSRKSLEKYKDIFEYHKNNIHKFNYYDEVRYYCSKDIYVLLKDLINELYTIDFNEGIWKEMPNEIRNKFIKTNLKNDISLVLLDKEIS